MMAISLPTVTSFALFIVVLSLIISYLTLLIVYRLLFCPLAAFPGPKLAALSNWYEFYYDVILQGQFTFHIKDLHETYGPIIRITPTELHIDDPSFHETLYARAGRRDRYSYFAGRFGYASDIFSTTNHDLHRHRRKAIDPMFSVQKIEQFQPMIKEKVDKLCRKIETYRNGQVLPLNRAWEALTTDIITEYSFARSYDQLDSPNFQETLHEALVAIYTVGHFALHFPIVFPILDMLPDWFVKMTQPEVLPVLGLRRDLAKQIQGLKKSLNKGEIQSSAHITVFQELLTSDLPEEEKTDVRLGDEAQLIVAAGLITTSWSLSVASFHIISNSDIYHKLRKELESIPSTSFSDWHKLEQLPYLSGCVHESLRLSHGVATRSPRLAPDVELNYADWVIPKNTPVSMTAIHILMNESIFPEPRKFKPERWIGRSDLERYFVPFGKGSRQCAGINLAQAELYIALATVFHRFVFETFETDLSDVEMAHGYLVPYPKWDSKGVRVTVST